MPVMQYLFHLDEFISGKSLDIALKLESSPSGKKMLASLDFFFIVTFDRLKMERKAGLRKPKQLRKKMSSQNSGSGHGHGKGKGHGSNRKSLKMNKAGK